VIPNDVWCDGELEEISAKASILRFMFFFVIRHGTVRFKHFLSFAKFLAKSLYSLARQKIKTKRNAAVGH
jgi:hypothetical protein